MIDCDDSQYAIGFVLLQQQNPRLTQGLGECVSILQEALEGTAQLFGNRTRVLVVWSVLYLSSYIGGSHVKVRTDHAAPRWVLTLPDATGRLMRWSLWHMEFDYEIMYWPGCVHQVLDAISRLPQSNEDTEDVQAEIEDTIPTFKKDVAEIICEFCYPQPVAISIQAVQRAGGSRERRTR